MYAKAMALKVWSVTFVMLNQLGNSVNMWSVPLLWEMVFIISKLQKSYAWQLNRSEVF